MTSEGKVTRIHHIGVTVNNAQQAVEQWTALFDCEGKVIDIPENKLRIGVVQVAGVTFFLNEYTDPSRRATAIEGLSLPVTFSGHQVVNEAGEGISHIAFEATDLEQMLARAEAVGVRIAFEQPRNALEGICNFLDPQDAHIPLEFMQPVEGRENPLA